MKFIRNTVKILKYNLKSLLIFEIMSKVLISLVFVPIAVAGFNFTMKVTGYKYLTMENIMHFACKPMSIALLLLIIIFLTIVTLFDISTMLIMYDASYNEKKIKVIDAIKLSVERLIPLLKIRNIPVAFLLLFLIPFLNVGMSSNVISSIKIPDFILDYIDSSDKLSSLLFTIYVFLSAILINWIFSIHYMVLEGKDFNEARKCSYQLIKQSQLKDIVKVIAVQFLVTVLYIAFVFIGLMIIYGVNAVLRNHLIIESVLITVVGIFIAVALALAAILSNATNYAAISSLYYIHKAEKKERMSLLNYKEVSGHNKDRKVIKRTVICVYILALFGGTILTYQVMSGKTNINMEQVRAVEITAHRGASLKYPENTMAAFRGAKNMGADWIELDVQQTRDRKLVVCHDSNLKRIAGVNKNIIEMDYEEVNELDAGSHFNVAYKDEKIPLLEDVIKYAQFSGIRLNIELKPTGREVEFENDVINLIKKYNFEDMCVITSLKYNVLENVKEIDSNIKTVYVMTIAIGEITDLEYADCYSVEAMNVTKKLVKKVHNKGKELYVWTVNDEDTINDMIDYNVDNIITDDVEKSKAIAAKKKQGGMVIEIIDMMQTFLKIK